MIARGRVGKMYCDVVATVLHLGMGSRIHTGLEGAYGTEYNEAPMLAAQVQAGKLCLRCMSGCHRSWWTRSGNTGALGTC